MTFPKFIFGLVSVLLAVVLWSLLEGAGVGTVLVRAAVAAVLVQVGYFVAICVSALRVRKLREGTADEDRMPAKAVEKTGSDKLTARGPTC